MADLPDPPSEPGRVASPAAVPAPPRTRPGGGRPASPLTFGSRPLVGLIGLLLLGTVFVAGVLGYRDHRDDGASAARTVGTTAPAVSTTAAAQTAAPTKCLQPNGVPKVSGKPTDIPVPPKPVTALQTRDLKPGRGKAAVDGDNLTVQYVGISCASGKQFDASWDRKQPLPFALGAGNVIPGWDQGIKGMKVGGRRLLWIPASLAYGAAGRPPDIAPSDTLIFVIDLVKIG
jgi:peptidylprolyl isomerase